MAGRRPVGVFLGSEWDQETKMLSPAATGAWVELRRAWAIGVDHTQLSASLVEWARLWRAKVDHASAILTELVTRGLVRVDPSEFIDINHPLTIHYLTMEAQDISSLKSSLKVYKSKKDKKKKEKTLIPEPFEFSEKRKAFAVRYHVINPENEFEKFCTRAMSKSTEHSDWDAAWRYWVLRGVDEGWIKTTRRLVGP